MDCTLKYFIHNQNIKPVAEFDEELYSQGTSIYEVARVENGIALFIEDHIERLFSSAQILNLKILINKNNIYQSIRLLISENEVSVGKIKILIHFNAVTNDQENFLLYFSPHYFPSVDEYKNGVKTGLCQAMRLNPNAKIHNTITRLKANHVIAEKKLFEVILFDNAGTLTEGSRSNLLFIAKGSVISAPEKDILQGIARKNVKRICLEIKISFIERKININELNNMDAAFLTGTSLKILPVKNIEGFTFKTNNKVLKNLMYLYDEEIRKYIHKSTSPAN